MTTTTHYLWIPESWGEEPVTADEERAACERAEEWLDDHESERNSIRVRPGHRNEIAGVYLLHDNGKRQILGCSVPLPSEIEELTTRAWWHAVETWGNEEEASE